MQPSAYLSPPFIERMMRQFSPEKNIRVLTCEPLAIDNSASILAVLTAGLSDARIGHFGLAVTFDANGRRQTRHMVMKVKPHGDAIVGMTLSLARACGGELAAVYPTYQRLSGFQHTHTRESDIYGHYASALFPEIFGLHADPEQGAYLILMEYLEEVTLMNSVMAPAAWSDKHIRQALDQLAVWHARYLNGEPHHAEPPHAEPLLNPADWDDAPGTAYMVKLTPLWSALLGNAAEKFPSLYTPVRVARLREAIRSIPAYWSELEPMPKTLIHNDLNPRNTCFKTVAAAPAFCVYDWELATRHVPQYDIVELLCFVLDADRYHLRRGYLAHYRNTLHQLTGLCADEPAFWRGVELAAFDFGLHRLGMYMMAHSVSPYPFLPRVVNSYFDTLAQFRPDPLPAW